MQALGCLVNITNFEFLCRKLHFGHAGIVQNFNFFSKNLLGVLENYKPAGKPACGVHPWDAKTNDNALLNLRANNDAERYAQLTNLEQKITGTNNEILTGLSM